MLRAVSVPTAAGDGHVVVVLLHPLGMDRGTRGRRHHRGLTTHIVGLCFTRGVLPREASRELSLRVKGAKSLLCASWGPCRAGSGAECRG